MSSALSSMSRQEKTAWLFSPIEWAFKICIGGLGLIAMMIFNGVQPMAIAFSAAILMVIIGALIYFGLRRLDRAAR